jgi:hypothetical protein
MTSKQRDITIFKHFLETCRADEASFVDVSSTQLPFHTLSLSHSLLVG